jgi:hypothetical protein
MSIESFGLAIVTVLPLDRHYNVAQQVARIFASAPEWRPRPFHGCPSAFALQSGERFGSCGKAAIDTSIANHLTSQGKFISQRWKLRNAERMLAGVVQVEIHLSCTGASEFTKCQLFCGAASYVAFRKEISQARSISALERHITKS